MKGEAFPQKIGAATLPPGKERPSRIAQPKPARGATFSLVTVPYWRLKKTRC